MWRDDADRVNSMKREINPQESNRAEAFSMWMSSPMPMVMWGKYRQGLFKTILPVSFQFHHVQMDGGQAATFLQRLQDEINKLR
jgi:chloramphenicol O-acetyltransferase